MKMVFKVVQMIRQFYLFKKYPFTKEFVKFCMVGATNFVIDISIYTALTRLLGIYYIIAAIISASIAITWSFFINKKWTFKDVDRRVRTQYVKFFIANIISLITSLILLYISVDIYGINDLLAKVIITVLVAFLNFTINKLWTFGKKPTVSEEIQP